MDETMRQALLLAAEGRSVDDIAAMLGIDAVAVDALLEQGRHDAHVDSMQMLVRAEAFSSALQRGTFRSADFTRPLLSHLNMALRAEGFRRRGFTFVREPEEGLLQGHPGTDGPPLPQRPSGPSLTYGQFAINLLIDRLDVYNLVGADSNRAQPYAPGLGSVVHLRLGHLVQRFDRWWPMEGDAAETGDAVLNEISEHGLPLMSTLDSRMKLVAALQRDDGTRWARPAPIVLAAILFAQQLARRIVAR